MRGSNWSHGARLHDSSRVVHTYVHEKNKGRETGGGRREGQVSSLEPGAWSLELVSSGGCFGLAIHQPNVNYMQLQFVVMRIPPPAGLD